MVIHRVIHINICNENDFEKSCVDLVLKVYKNIGS